MKKRVLAMAMSLVFLVSAMTAYASPLKDIIGDLGISVGSVINVSVDADLSSKMSTATTFGNNTLAVNTGDVVDFQAYVDMSKVREAYNTIKSVAMDKAASAANKAELEAEFAACTVTGQFTITVDYPQGYYTVPTDHISGSGMYGFSTTAGKDLTALYEEASRTCDTTNGTFTVVVNVKSGVTPAVIEANMDDLYYTLNNVVMATTGTVKTKLAVTGYTDVYSGAEKLGTINYNFKQYDTQSATMGPDPDGVTGEISVTTKPVPGPGPGPSGGGTTYYTLKLIDGEKETVKSYTRNSTADLVVLAGEKEGFEIEGFYLDAEFTEKTESPYKVTEDVVIYVKWQEVKDTPDSPFKTDDHFAYIIGYPSENGSKEVRPENNISREEIATIFYRLVKDEVRNKYYTTSNNFSDVEESRWSNEYISTIAKGGFILGDTEGTFRPEDYITRAEFVTIAARFFDADGANFIVDDKYTDIDGHWGESFINYAVNAGWIDGYGDGTFRPDAYITRAETMKIINAILNRHVDKDGLIDGYVIWDDNSENAWYYYEVIEATNTHEYGRVQDSNLEKWTKIVK